MDISLKLKNLSELRLTRKNSGWFILILFIIICIIGLFYEIMNEGLSIPGIIIPDIQVWPGLEAFDMGFYLFKDNNAHYFDIFIFLVNSFFSVINLILSSFTAFRINSIFAYGGRWFTIVRSLADAAIITLQISLVSIALGFFIALILAVILVLPGRVYGLKYFSQAYVDFFRSTPLLVQLFLIYFGIPPVYHSLTGLTFPIGAIEAAILGLSLNTAAYQAEILRGGILAIPTGQTEAARGLGLSSAQTMRFVILPQALRIIIPPFTNEGINIILNSSLASVISVYELTLRAKTLASFYFIPFEIYFTSAIFYFIMCFSLAKLTKRMEKKFRIPGLGVHHD
ncbi:MAG: amino acid ABC transporter permease [Candidatus Hodarchaeales archaeon]